MRCVVFHWLLRVHLQASIKFVYSLCREEKNYTRPGIAFRFSCSVQRLVTWNIAFWTHQRQRDKAKCKDKIVCRRLSGKSTQSFQFPFVDQAYKDAAQKLWRKHDPNDEM